MAKCALNYVRILLIALAIILIPASFFGGYIYHKVYSEYSTTSAVIYIDRGQSISQVANILFDERIITSKTLFTNLARVYSLQHQYIKAGEYHFESGMNLNEVLAMLIEGKTYNRKITIVEGDTVKEAIDKINNRDDLSGDLLDSAKYLEGSFLPNTYFFHLNYSRQNLVETLMQQMQQAITREWEGRPATKSPIITQNEALILASIVEKEAMLTHEMPIIASVYINRLNRGMRLQADPTVIYGITLGKHDLGRQLTRKDLRKKTPYNTYINYGLPPTPICNPSIAAINAVLHPKQTDYLFFVANTNGGHWFAKSYKDHKSNVARYRKSQRQKRKK